MLDGRFGTAEINRDRNHEARKSFIVSETAAAKRGDGEQPGSQRLHDVDKGPNTGGRARIHRPVVTSMVHGARI